MHKLYFKILLKIRNKLHFNNLIKKKRVSNYLVPIRYRHIKFSIGDQGVKKREKGRQKKWREGENRKWEANRRT